MGKADKIAALLDSPFEGEREAARAAMTRLRRTRPQRGSPQWLAAVAEHHRKIEFLARHLGNKRLAPSEVRTIRNLQRYKGEPWDRAAETVESLCRKLEAE